MPAVLTRRGRAGLRRLLQGRRRARPRHPHARPPGDGEPAPPRRPPPTGPRAPRPRAGRPELEHASIARRPASRPPAPGFLAGEQVQVFLHSTPRFLTVGTADAQGTAAPPSRSRPTSPPASHRVELRGVTSGRSIMSPITLTVTARGPDLPRTGSAGARAAPLGAAGPRPRPAGQGPGAARAPPSSAPTAPAQAVPKRRSPASPRPGTM